MQSRTEVTLDPQDWSALRHLGHRMVDDMLEHLRTLGERPAWQPVPPEVRSRLSAPLPLEGSGAAQVYEDFKRDVLPYPNGNLHPRFWGWVQGNGTPLAMLADMLASGLNPHLAGFEQAPALVEEQVLAWLKTLLGFSPAASGLLTSGGSMANLLGLAVARNTRAGWDVRREGLRGQPGLVVYASSETHSWVQKACELLGLGQRALRRLPVDEAFRLSLPHLEAALAADRAAGRRPLCVVATAGTVNSGAIDALPRLAQLCRQEGLWLHVDGAFGALAALSPEHRHLVAGLEEADSLVFDLHKWMYLPFEAGCLLVRDATAHRAAFALDGASYLAPAGRGVAAGPLQFADRGVELTRSFRALKVWMSLKAHGARLFGRLIAQNIEQARALAARIRAEPHLELMAPVPLNVVCFRFRAAGLGEEQLDALNTELLLRLQESGVAVPSGTRIRGRFALRVAIVNHRSRREDFELLLSHVRDLGAALAREAV